MQGFWGDIKLIITKTILWIGIFIIITLGMYRWSGNNLGEKLEEQKIIAITQSISYQNYRKCKKPYQIYQKQKNMKDKPVLNIYNTDIYTFTLDILIYKTCQKKWKQKQ